MLAATLFFSCQTAPISVSKSHYAEFDVDGTEYRWGDDATIGFLDVYGTYYDLYAASDSYHSTNPDVFQKYLFINIADKVEGTYTNTVSETSIFYYDQYGRAYSYYTIFSGCYVNITITKWSENEVRGSFSAKLYCTTASNYVNLTGIFVSFDSSGLLPGIGVLRKR